MILMDWKFFIFSILYDVSLEFTVIGFSNYYVLHLVLLCKHFRDDVYFIAVVRDIRLEKCLRTPFSLVFYPYYIVLGMSNLNFKAFETYKKFYLVPNWFSYIMFRSKPLQIWDKEGIQIQYLFFVLLDIVMDVVNVSVFYFSFFIILSTN